MKPAWSVVAFTVLSGAGLGMLVLLAVMACFGGLAGVAQSDFDALLLPGIALALALTVGGLLSSTLHLGKAVNARFALSRWRTSWLSREGIVSIVLVLVAATWWLARWHGRYGLAIALAIATFFLALGTLFCTAMIYASLKPIRQWHTRRVPLVLLLLALASGSVLLLALLRIHGFESSPLAWGSVVLLALAALAKLDYYAFIAGPDGRIRLEDAIGVPQGVRRGGPSAPLQPAIRARLLDAGHGGATFLTEEFLHTLTPQWRSTLRIAVWACLFVVPALWALAGSAGWPGSLAAVAVLFAGLLAERWLFFAEARHTVRLYHGEAQT